LIHLEIQHPLGAGVLRPPQDLCDTLSARFVVRSSEYPVNWEMSDRIQHTCVVSRDHGLGGDAEVQGSLSDDTD
jgi:hypothetical protein